MSLNVLQKRVLVNKIIETYKKHLSQRLTTKQIRCFNTDRYTPWWNKTAELLMELNLTPEQWIEVQFHEFPRNLCMKIFKLAVPPPQVLCTPAAVDRFVCYAGRNNSLDMTDPKFMERKTLLASVEFVRMLKSVNCVTDVNSHEWMDLILIHINSGDISLVWLCSQTDEWMVEFFKRNGAALNASVVKLLDNKIKREYLERYRSTTIQ